MDAGSFGAFIAGCRRKSGMTQAQLAVKLNVTDKAVSRWERGIGFPDISTIEPLASALGMSVQDLMKSNKQGNEEHGFCMVEMPYFEPFKTYPRSMKDRAAIRTLLIILKMVRYAYQPIKNLTDVLLQSIVTDGLNIMGI